MKLNVQKLQGLMHERGLSQSELARRSGVSRATIARLLTGVSDNVQAETERKLCVSLGSPQGSLDREGMANAYLEQVAKQHEALDFTGLGIVSRSARIPMDRGYVPVGVRHWRHDGACSEEREESARTVPRAERHSRAFSLSSALVRRRRIFLLGDPGCGKTTALRHIARAYALRTQSDCSYPPEPLVPVLIRLAEWADQLGDDPAVALVDAAVAQLAAANAGETSAWLARQIKDKNALLLLDGLDEVADPDAQALVIEKLRAFVEANREVRVVISSRIVGFEPPNVGARFDTLAVQPLPTKSMRQFSLQWCALRHGHDPERPCAECERRLDALRHAILDHARIRVLAGSPMMLTILVLLHEAGAALPQRRWQLYEKICEAFLFSWEQRKRSALSGAPDGALKVDDRELLWLLESLALEMQRHDWTLVARWWLSEHVGSFLRDELGFEPNDVRAEADTLIWSLQERSGLLVERGPARFGFSHLAFQEYFAARGILACDDPLAELQPFFYHPRWREVVRLVAAQLDRRRVPQLLRVMLDDPDPAGRFLQRGLLLALACLADGAPLHHPVLLRQMAGQIADLGRSNWLGIALEAVGSLSQLRGTRLEAFATDAADRLLARAAGALNSSEFLGLAFAKGASGLGGEAGDLADDVEYLTEHGYRSNKPFSIAKVPIKDKTFEIKLVGEPDKIGEEWVQAVMTQLVDDESPDLRRACAHELRSVGRRKEVRQVLMRALEEESEPEVKRAIAEAMEPASTYREVRSSLERMLHSGDDPRVRGGCARALRRAARRFPTVRRKLLSLLRSGEAPEVRAGAARGLSRCVAEPSEARDVLMAALKDSADQDQVRSACLWALEAALPSIPGAVPYVGTLLCGQPDALHTRVAAQILAGYAAEGRAPWRELPIEHVERVLMSLKQPCQHALDALRALVAAREARRLGVPREARIKRALRDVHDRIRLAFVFGSSARGEQGPESDIDLLLIGDVALRDAAPALRRAEQELGRQINVVIYSDSEWRKRCAEKDPFVMNILRGKKVLVLGEADELAAMAG